MQGTQYGIRRHIIRRLVSSFQRLFLRFWCCHGPAGPMGPDPCQQLLSAASLTAFKKKTGMRGRMTEGSEPVAWLFSHLASTACWCHPQCGWLTIEAMLLVIAGGGSRRPNSTSAGLIFCEQHTSHVTFSRVSQHTFECHIDIGSRTRCVARISYMCHLHVVCCLILYDSPFYSLLSIFSLIFLFHSPDHLHLPCGGQEPCALLRMRTLASWPRTILSQVLSQTTSTSQRLLIGSSRSPAATTGPSHDLKFDDYTIGMALSSPLFTQEREEPAGRGQACHSREESLLSSPSFIGHVRTVNPVN